MTLKIPGRRYKYNIKNGSTCSTNARTGWKYKLGKFFICSVIKCLARKLKTIHIFSPSPVKLGHTLLNDKSLARPTSRCILFNGENISFEASLVIYINSTNIPPIMIINRIYEHQNLLSL